MRTTRTIRIVRGQLGGEPWGYDVELDGETVEHVGGLGSAETFANGLAVGLHLGTGHDVEVRFGPQGESTRRADLEPERAEA